MTDNVFDKNVEEDLYGRHNVSKRGRQGLNRDEPGGEMGMDCSEIESAQDAEHSECEIIEDLQKKLQQAYTERDDFQAKLAEEKVEGGRIVAENKKLKTAAQKNHELREQLENQLHEVSVELSELRREGSHLLRTQAAPVTTTDMLECFKQVRAKSTLLRNDLEQSQKEIDKLKAISSKQEAELQAARRKVDLLEIGKLNDQVAKENLFLEANHIISQKNAEIQWLTNCVTNMDIHIESLQRIIKSRDENN